MSNLLEIGVRIKTQRELLGITREELAEYLDVTPRFCYDLEQGNKGMSVNTLCKLCTVLNISADYLLFGNDEKIFDYAEAVSLLKECPPSKKEYLMKIMSHFVQAVKSPTK